MESTQPTQPFFENLADLKWLGQNQDNFADLEQKCQHILDCLPSHCYSRPTGSTAYETLCKVQKLREFISTTTVTAESNKPGTDFKVLPGTDLDDFVLVNDDYIAGQVGVLGSLLIIPIWDAATKEVRIVAWNAAGKSQKIICDCPLLSQCHPAPRIDVTVGNHKIIATYTVPRGYLSGVRTVVQIWNESDCVSGNDQVPVPSLTYMRKGVSGHGPIVTIEDKLLLGLNNEGWVGSDGYLLVADLMWQATQTRSIWNRLFYTDAPQEEAFPLPGRVLALEVVKNRVAIAHTRGVDIFDWKTGARIQHILGAASQIDKIRLLRNIVVLGARNRIIVYSIADASAKQLKIFEEPNKAFETVGSLLVVATISDNLSLVMYKLRNINSAPQVAYLNIDTDNDPNNPYPRLLMQAIDDRLLVTDGKRIHQISVHENASTAKAQRIHQLISGEHRQQPPSASPLSALSHYYWHLKG